jgi:nicotinate-nucleotide pyrophosphorylase
MSKKKKYMVTIDVIDSFNCEIEAETKAEALEKAEKLEADMVMYHNVPHWTDTKVIGVDGEPFYE